MQFVSSHLDNKIKRQVEGKIWFIKTLMKPHIMNFLSGKFFLLEKDPVGKFSVRFIHKNNQAQFLFLANYTHTVVSPRTSQLRSLIDLLTCMFCFSNIGPRVTWPFVYPAWQTSPCDIRSNERGTRVKDSAKMASRFISRAAKTENSVPQSFFALKLNQTETLATQATLCLLRVFSWVMRTYARE